jgi:enoyl-CoA hydratase/carnithine racemase
MADYQEIQYQLDGDGVVRILLDAPPLHLVSERMEVELLDAFRQAERDPQVRVILLGSTGEKAFSAGGNINRFQERQATVAAIAAGLVTDRWGPIYYCPKPVIAVIKGYAIGRGMQLALAADIRLASDTARFRMPEVIYGGIPNSGATQRLPRLIGEAATLELLYTANWLDAAEAFRLGLVNRVAPLAEVEAVATAMARQIAGHAPLALRQLKEAVKRGQDLPLAEGLRLEAHLGLLIGGSEDSAEGLRAWRERRAPRFIGR